MLDRVRDLHALGADLEVSAGFNHGRPTVLFCSVSTYHYELVEYLLTAGVDPNAVSVRDLLTPLMLAAMWDSQVGKITELLLNSGADRTMIDSCGETTADKALRHGRMTVLQLLTKTRKIL